MDDPIAYFLTWPTYGTWLPGDARGWILFREGWKLPDSARVLEAEAKMAEDACFLSADARHVVEEQIAETCDARHWKLFAANCRSNHVHVLVGATSSAPKKIRVDLKAWSTRRLKEQIDSSRENWWAERGSIRWVCKESQLESVLSYVVEAQDRMHLERKR